MAIIDTLRFRNILVNGDIAEEEPAQQLVTALDESLDDIAGNLATKQDLAQGRAELIAEMRAMETRLTRQILYGSLGLFTALAALMTLLQVFVN